MASMSVFDRILKRVIHEPQAFLIRLVQGALFRKYVMLFAGVMAAVLVTESLINIWFTYREHHADLIRFQRAQASAAATRISQFIKEIEGQLGWMTHLSWSHPAADQRELDGLRLLRQVPAITELSLLDPHGREQMRLSRQAMDRVGSNADYSNEERFRTALSGKVYYGPVYFRRETEPYMTLAVSGARRDGGVTVAEVNLKYIWDVVSQIRVGEAGRAYVVDARGRLIAHPDISLVLRNTDLSGLAQVRAARTSPRSEPVRIAYDNRGERVLTAFAPAEPLDWLVFVEVPEQEANAPLYDAIKRSVIVVLAGLLFASLAAIVLARRMAVPIQTLSTGASRIGAGALDHRISIATGDELEALGAEFNRMAAQLQSSYATLERKVDERTGQLQQANLAKSRFLAAASHDLRQPLHALNLFVAQLRAEKDQAQRSRLAHRIDDVVGNMNGLFNALLDISKLDAGAMQPSLSDFPVGTVLSRIETTFGAAAREKGLHLRVVQSSGWVRSDAVLVERILMNFVSNAVRYTERGGIVVGCRRVGDGLRIDVCDSGAGIAPDQQRSIFGEFYRLQPRDKNHSDGLGLGLAIVERLGALLDHPIGLVSVPGKGSRFSITLPSAPVQTAAVAVAERPATSDPLRGRLVVVIDDDAMVLDGTRGLLESWGCRVVTAASDGEALERLGGKTPDLIISDFRLPRSRTGIDAIAAVRQATGLAVPAFLISGDISPDRLDEARTGGHHLLHKPVSPMTLRAMMTRMLRDKTRHDSGLVLGLGQLPS